ncbi:leucine-rich repeat-containing protein 58 isoform X2 [Agrilus planipennis]|uniref:Leucine-rich repeat-containing protein 58 isoform X2 n=1 Tax=Agrilus planipennis TaxID=224129 RepID=A0A1W4XAV4_AGRPL|nr:leucine-rich repeat-containing protein 58 isoform X2 [Agrilus planipennis]
MENYTSDSSDNDSANKTLDFSYLSLDGDSFTKYLEDILINNKKTYDEIENISIHHNHFELFPEPLLKFNNLKTLDISSNGLTVLPDIFKCCNLTTFTARNNNLTNESLPKTFSVNYSCRELNLNGNCFTEFPEQILDLINLKYLYLGGNKITSISRNIGKLSNLQILSMGGNALTEIPASVGQLKMLHALVLCDNQIECLPSNITQLKHLKSLLLHKNHLRTLPPEIVLLKNLTELSLRDNPLVVRFVSDMTYNPASLLELAARTIKLHNLKIKKWEIPQTLTAYLESGHRCVNPNCQGVYFDNRVEHIKFVDFCGKYRIPLLQYLCSSKCIQGGSCYDVQLSKSHMMRKVLLG